MNRRYAAVLASIAAAAVVAVGCGGDDDEGGSAEGGGSGETLTVWNNEFQPDRMAATQAILDEFTQKTGIKTKQVAVPEDQLATLMTNAAASDELPVRRFPFEQAVEAYAWLDENPREAVKVALTYNGFDPGGGAR